MDFNETDGTGGGTTATVHLGASNSQDHRSVAVTSEIPNQAMTLDLDQQTSCGSDWACPTAPQSELIDWKAEYGAN
jgi:hypothetical protein